MGRFQVFNTFDAGSLGMCRRLFRPLPDPVRPSAHEPNPGGTFRRLAAASWGEDRRQSVKAYRANRIGPHDGHKRAPSRRVQILEVTYLRTGDAGPSATLRTGLEDACGTGSTAAHQLEEAGLVHDGHAQLPGLIQLGAGALTGQQVIGVATHG